MTLNLIGVARGSGGGGDVSTAVILAPATSARNIIQPTADVIPLIIRGGVGQTANWFQIQNSSEQVMVAVGVISGATAVGIGGAPSAGINLQIFGTAGAQLRMSSGGTASFNLNQTGTTGACTANIDMFTGDATSNAFMQMFRSLNTSGTVGLYILRGNGTSTTNHLLGGNQNSYLVGNNSNLGIGAATAPGAKVHVFGAASAVAMIIRANATTPGDILQLQSAAPATLVKVNSIGVFFPLQAPTASAPTYTIGGVYFDTTLNKLRVGGASGWETVTSS